MNEEQERAKMFSYLSDIELDVIAVIEKHSEKIDGVEAVTDEIREYFTPLLLKIRG